MTEMIVHLARRAPDGSEACRVCGRLLFPPGKREDRESEYVVEVREGDVSLHRTFEGVPRDIAALPEGYSFCWDAMLTRPSSNEGGSEAETD